MFKFYAASFLAASIGLITALPAHAQLVNPLEFSATSTVSAVPVTSYKDFNRIRVGISDDAMTAQEYPNTRLSATGAFTITDEASKTIVFSGDSGEVASVSVNKTGFVITKASGNNTPVKKNPTVPFLQQQSKASVSSFLPPTIPEMALPSTSVQSFQTSSIKGFIPSLLDKPVVGPLLVQTVKPTDHLKITNITRRKIVPEYRGIFEIVRGVSGAPNALSVINILSLEDYLKAVVPNELPMRYGWEAVKAQTIAARNYAIRPRERPWSNFDVCDSQLCQVYLGAQTETPTSNKAISETEGLIALYDGQPILALFSSSHGGYAENYSNAFSDPVTKEFPAPEIPYLKGGPDILGSNPLDLTSEIAAKAFWSDQTVQSFDVSSPLYRWSKHWTREEMETALNEGLLDVSKEPSTKAFINPIFKPGQSIGTLRNLKILQRGVSGKAMVLQVEGSNGSWLVRKEFLIRRALRNQGKPLPSANIVLNLQRNPLTQELEAISVNGGGFGHGVGLSQLGASWMSGHGFSYIQIVQHYYPGVSIGSIPVIVGDEMSNSTVTQLSPSSVVSMMFSTKANTVQPADSKTAAKYQPAMTRFEVVNNVGTLWLQEGEGGMPTPFNKDPVEVVLNGRHLNVSPDGYRSGIAISEYLQPHQLNSLMLIPDTKHPYRRLKAWVELYPAKTTR